MDIYLIMFHALSAPLLLLLPGVGQNTAVYASPASRNSTVAISVLAVHSAAFSARDKLCLYPEAN